MCGLLLLKSLFMKYASVLHLISSAFALSYKSLALGYQILTEGRFNPPQLLYSTICSGGGNHLLKCTRGKKNNSLTVIFACVHYQNKMVKKENRKETSHRF